MVKRELQSCAGWNFLQGRGIHKGCLIGGCIEVLDWLRGTSIWPELSEWEGTVLFLETSEDGPSPLAVARMLRTLAAQGVLKRISGLLFGRPGGQVGSEHFSEYDQAILEICVEEEGLSELPIVTGWISGTPTRCSWLPYGVELQINCERQENSDHRKPGG